MGRNIILERERNIFYKCYKEKDEKIYLVHGWM